MENTTCPYCNIYLPLEHHKKRMWEWHLGGHITKESKGSNSTSLEKNMKKEEEFYKEWEYIHREKQESMRSKAMLKYIKKREKAFLTLLEEKVKIMRTYSIFYDQPAMERYELLRRKDILSIIDEMK